MEEGKRNKKSVEAGVLKHLVRKPTEISDSKRVCKGEHDLIEASSQKSGLCGEEEVCDLQEYNTD